MTNFDIEACLKSMSVIVDNREQPTTKRYEQRVNSLSVPYRRQTLDYGDYTFNCILPDGSELYGPNELIRPSVMIERKMNLEELSSCFTRDRDRFKAEFQRASDEGAIIYLLVEDCTWEGIFAGHYKTRFNPVAFVASILGWSARYKIRLIFCKHESSGKIIKEILYRELKEKLESGEYD